MNGAFVVVRPDGLEATVVIENLRIPGESYLTKITWNGQWPPPSGDQVRVPRELAQRLRIGKRAHVPDLTSMNHVTHGEFTQLAAAGSRDVPHRDDHLW